MEIHSIIIKSIFLYSNVVDKESSEKSKKKLTLVDTNETKDAEEPTPDKSKGDEKTEVDAEEKAEAEEEEEDEESDDDEFEHIRPANIPLLTMDIDSISNPLHSI